MNVLKPLNKTRSLRLLVDDGQTDRPPAVRGRLRVGWFVVQDDIRSASTRYRCYHMARILAHYGIDNVYMTRVDRAAVEMKTLDVMIVVKRLDRSALQVAALAHQRGVPLLLDLCDDLISDAYGKNAQGINKIHFAAIAVIAEGITVPSAAMAGRIRDYGAELGLPHLSVHVIPDIAETRALYRTTADFIDPAHVHQAPEPPAAQTPGGRKQVLWYGNAGSRHSNFGILSLFRAVQALEAVNQDVPLELVVISNDADLFRDMTAGYSFATRYVPWTAEATYDELDRADVAILTSGTDAFCTIKSSNRTLQALASGVPVITDAGPALAEFTDVILPGNHPIHMESSLRKCLSLDPADRKRRLIDPAAPILARYTPQALASLWRRLLVQIDKTGKTSETMRESVLFLIEQEADSKSLRGPLVKAHKAGVVCDVLIPKALVADPGVQQLLLQTQLVPRVYSEPEDVYDGTLRLSRALVLGKANGLSARRLRAFAGQQDVPVYDAADLPGDWPAPLVPKTAMSGHALAGPGPYPERRNPDGSAKWVFVVHPNAKGWILDAICREIGSRQPDSWCVAYNPPRLPPAEVYFFSHFSLYQNNLNRYPEQMRAARCMIWYTHPRSETAASVAALTSDLAQAHQVICACSSNRDLWLARGLSPDRVSVVLGGADPDLFTGHQRGGGAIGLSSSFYERKNPDCLRELVDLMPHRNFVLLGRNWEQYARFEDLKAAPNFTYITAPYRDYPTIYAGFDVLLSMSRLEGGPIPLLEAMMENVVPVASDTGFAPDLIRHGENGYLFDIDAGAAEIAELIEQAFRLRTDVRSTVIAYDWDGFARRIAELAEGT